MYVCSVNIVNMLFEPHKKFCAKLSIVEIGN